MSCSTVAQRLHRLSLAKQFSNDEQLLIWGDELYLYNLVNTLGNKSLNK